MLLFANDNLQTYILAAGVILLCWMMMRQRLTRSAKESKEEVSQPAEETARFGLKDASRDFLRWEVAMHELARDLRAEFDTKAAVLQTLVGQARTEVERLEAAITKAEQLGLNKPNVDSTNSQPKRN